MKFPLTLPVQRPSFPSPLFYCHIGLHGRQLSSPDNPWAIYTQIRLRIFQFLLRSYDIMKKMNTKKRTLHGTWWTEFYKKKIIKKLAGRRLFSSHHDKEIYGRWQAGLVLHKSFFYLVFPIKDWKEAYALAISFQYCFQCTNPLICSFAWFVKRIQAVTTQCLLHHFPAFQKFWDDKVHVFD